MAARTFFKSRALKRTLIILAALLGLAAALLIGLIIWLQSRHAENFLAGLLTEQLAGQGLYLSMDELAGPLPRRLYARNLALADEHGVWLTVKELEVRVKLVSLLKWQLNLPVVRLEEPKLLRLPDTGTQGEPSAAEANGKSGPFKLPIAFRLGSIKLTDGHIGPELLGLGAPISGGPDSGPEKNAAVPPESSSPARADSKAGELPSMSLTLQGSGTVSNSGISANLEAGMLHPDGSGFRVMLMTGPPESFSRDMQEVLRDKARDSQVGGETIYWPLGLDSKDRMIISVSARENAKGFLSGLLGQPGFPAYELQLRGFGAPQDWRGKFFFAAGDRGTLAASDNGNFLDEQDRGFIADNGRLGSLNGEIGLRSSDKSISFDKILDTSLTVNLKLKAEPGSRTPKEIAALFAPALEADLRAHINKYQPDIEYAALQTRGWSLDLRQVDYESSAGGGMLLNGGLKAALKDASFLAALRPGTSANDYAFIEKAEIETNVRYESGKPESRQAMRLQLDGRGAARLSGENLDISYFLDGTFASAGAGASGKLVDISDFRLDALGVKTSGQGKLDLDSGLMSVDASLHTQAGGAWHELLSRLSAGTDSREPGGSGIPDGQISLSLKADSNELFKTGGHTSGSRSQTSLSASLRGSRMLWPPGATADIFGNSLALEADFSGSESGGYRLRLRTLEAGLLSGRGEAALSGAGNPLQWGEINTAARVNADFDFRLASLEPLLGSAGSGVETSGAPRLDSPETGASLALKAAGRLNDLRLEANLSTAKLRTPSNATLRDVSARLTGVLRAAQKHSQGKLELSMVPGALEQLRLDSEWALDFGDSPRARVNDLLLTARGLRLNADLDFAAPPAQTVQTAHTGQTGGGDPAGASPVLSGQAVLDISEWRTLTALTGVRMSGDPAHLNLAFKPEPDGQRLEARWKMGHFGIHNAESGGQGVKQTVFSLNSLEGELDIADLFRKPVINMQTALGIGQTSLLSWSSGKAVINSDASAGDFNLALYGWGQRSGQRTGGSKRSSSSSRAETPKQPPRGIERLALNGRFQLSAPTVTLNNFVFRSGDDSVNIKLAAPATANLSRGVSLPELRLVMAPSGTLDASAEISGNDMKLDLDLQALSFKVFSLFTDAALPEGQINAGIGLTKQGRSVGGGMQIDAVMTPAASNVQIAEAYPDSPGGKPSAEEAKTGTGPKDGLQTVQPADNLAGQPFIFQLKAVLDKTPSALFPALRSSGNHIHLQGNGSLAYAGASPEGKSAVLDFSLPLALSADGMPAPDMNAPMGAKMLWQGHTAPLIGLFPLADREFSGYGKIDLTLGGSLAEPTYDGDSYLVNGRYEDKILGLLLEQIQLQANGNNRELSLLLSATDGQTGTLAIEGALRPPGDGGQTLAESANAAPSDAGAAPQLSVRGQINRLSPLHRDDLNLQISGIVSANGPIGKPSLSARLEVERGELTLLSTMGGGIQTLEIEDPDQEIDEQSSDAGMPLDAELTIPNRFYIRGYGMESEWAGTIRAAGTTSRPLVSGEIRPVRGYFSLLTRPFAFDRNGRILLDGTEKINPRLDIRLSHQAPSITAIINITGTANKPNFELTSNPVIPKDQILSEVIFGKSFSNLSRFEAIQVANSLRTLTSGGGGFDPLGSVRTTLGFDMLRISGGESTAPQQRNTYGTLGASELGGSSGSGSSGDDESMPSLEAGKYINNAIYVGVEQGITENSTGVRVEVELKPNLTLQGRSNTQSSEVGIGWKNDY